jgi:signal transduction histidine kinase
MALMLGAGLFPVAARAASENVLGLPFTRFYSFEEIGNASRGARLGFDELGRIAVMRGGSCIVLNDTIWTDLADKEASGAVMHRMVFGPDGTAYYCAFGSWGVAPMAAGKLRPRSLVPAAPPKWALNSNFNDIAVAESGVYFSGLNGVVYWDRHTGRHSFFAVPGVSHIFLLGGRLFLSSYTEGICALDVEKQTVETIRGPVRTNAEIDQVANFDATRVLTADYEGQLRLFDGHGFSPFPGPLGQRPLGRVTGLTRLPDGNVAVAVNGAGVYLVSVDGQILSSLTTPDYHRVTDLAAREKGVLWIVNENGVEKIFYNSPLTIFGQRQGLPLSWPQLVRWNDRIVVASGGRLYEAFDGPPGETMRFHLMPDQPADSMWALAAAGPDLLVGTNQGLYVRGPEGGFTPVLSGIDVSRLVHVNGVIYVLGLTEITALRQVGGRWTECAARVPGLGYPLVVHGTNRAAWLELGQNRAARVILREDRLHVRLFESFPWKTSHWINIGHAGDTVVLSGQPDGRVYFDEATETVIERPELGRTLDQAPYPINRFRQDAAGTIWATHDEGLLTIRRRDGQPVFDAATYGKINDRYPLIKLFPEGDVWLITGQSLYHVNRNSAAATQAAYKPTLVSLTNGRTNRELLEHPGLPAALPALPYEGNSLVLRFFAGSYASRQPPAYEFRLHRGNDSWLAVGNGSLLTLTDLREGSYRLEARVTDAQKPVGEPLSLAFVISPPWYRTWYAYLCYTLGITALVYGLMRGAARRTRSRNVVLEKLVDERTNELRVAMQQLNEETRNAATLAERDRLAGEIHDSLQQGLSGLMLHLDATLKLPDLPADVRARLSVARNMVSFTRHEVQHAVWDMETPLLEGTELGEALRKIAMLIGPGGATVQTTVNGNPTELPSAVKHHLLRIAQEAITNAVRHAAARTINIALTYEHDDVTLSVTDDGNGFVPSDVLTKGIGHFGLRGLRGRAAKIGGELNICSAPGHGTTVLVVVQNPAPALAHDR